ncbi:beta-lactamase [Stenotrophomonas terrae]|uniref:Beta-lactamase n=1 Tax=Stenotrophomonas terrae TaxID=405446 RepID=A0A0R0C9K1_9GAMM|nr:serine hydrolase domain-containing protein [Stenotrophomonas terrae]KRG65851.1 beta-lactamase [Stenotrophomonas terrae]
MPVPAPRYLLCLLYFLVVLCAPARAGTLDDANQAARRFMATTMKERGIPAMQVAVVKDGRVVFSEVSGLANVENQIAATRSTLFPINSATKAFTGVAMMQLVEAGQVDLDAPISTYLQQLPSAWQGIRVRQLLAHTSGLPDIVDGNGLVGGGSEAQAWQRVEQLPMQAAPGAQFVYNQTNYALLARIIAQCSGGSYEDYLAARQFKPLGMRHARFGDSYDLVPNAATMYSFFPRSSDAANAPARLSHWFYDMPHGLWAGGGIQITADELALWLAALLQHRVLRADSLARMWTPERLNDGSEGDWAAGWPVSTLQGRRQISSFGGARSAFVVYPEEGLAVVVLTNLVGANPQQFTAQIADFYR